MMERIIPLDSLLYPVFAEFGLRMRNRIVWHFEHGLHCSRRLSGRYEVILWFTKGDDYVFNLDPIRVPQKYPGKKYFKGPKAGQYSCNPLGKSPGDVWVIPNVKSNHVEKSGHPCQFPVELVERLVLALTLPGDWVLDPFLGTGTSIIAALRQNRRGVGAEVVERYRSNWLTNALDKLLMEPCLSDQWTDRCSIPRMLAGHCLALRGWSRRIVTNRPFSSGKRTQIPRAQMKIVQTYSHLNGLEYLLGSTIGRFGTRFKKVIAAVDANACRIQKSAKKKR